MRSIALFTGLAMVFVLAPFAAQAQDALVWATGNGSGSTQGVADYIFASGYFTSVTASDDAALTLADLMNYDAVLFFTNGCDGDMVSIGNILADYADTGRRLVLAVFSWANQGCNTLSGRIISDGISPFYYEGGSLYTNVTMASNDGHPMFNGVTTLEGYYHDNVAVTAGATQHGTWSDNEPLAATKNNVYAINLFPDDFFGLIDGDYQILFANALYGGVVDTDSASWTAVKEMFR
jgi:hypothetical protein